MRGLAAVPPGGKIVGIPADSFFRIGLAALAAALGAGSMLAFGTGRRDLGGMLAISGGVLTIAIAGAQAVESEVARGRIGTGAQG